MTLTKRKRPENKMGTMPINKLIINMSLPLITSMFVQAFYNIVDSLFVARINEDALTAVSMSFPAQNLMISAGVGVGVGVGGSSGFLFVTLKPWVMSPEYSTSNFLPSNSMTFPSSPTSLIA